MEHKLFIPLFIQNQWGPPGGHLLYCTSWCSGTNNLGGTLSTHGKKKCFFGSVFFFILNTKKSREITINPKCSNSRTTGVPLRSWQCRTSINDFNFNFYDYVSKWLDWPTHDYIHHGYAAKQLMKHFLHSELIQDSHKLMIFSYTGWLSDDRQPTPLIH